MSQLEFRRQSLHVFYGFTLVLLHSRGLIDNNLLLGIILGGAAMSFLVKRQKLSLVQRFLHFFERQRHLESFPGRGPLFFTIGSYLSLLLFPEYLAYAGIMILTVGDAFSNIIGRHFGRIKTPLNPDKCIEGNLAGILIAIPFAYYFFPNIYAVVAASTVGMFLEIPNIHILGFEIDDNLIIPLGAAFTLTLFA